jgi:hypothetical protein
MGLIPANLMFRRELWLHCDLLFGGPPTRNDPQSVM